MTVQHPEPRFRLAIVGAGLITRNTHLPTALSVPGVEVVALVDPVVERARDLIDEYGLKALAVASVNEVIGRCDGAIVATPNHTHRDVAVPLLEAGISTLIEKPLCTTVEEGEAILAAAQRSGARVGIGHYQRFLDAPRHLIQLLDQGQFGMVRRFYHQFGTPGGWPALSAYTLQRRNIGGGVLVVTGTHFLDRMLAMWGMPDEFSLMEDAFEGPEAHCEARVRFRRPGQPDLEGCMRYSKCVPLPAGLTLETDAGLVMLRDGFLDRITVWPQGRAGLRTEIVTPVDSYFPRGLDPSQRMLWDFVHACRQGRDPIVSGEQGLQLMRLLRHFYECRQPLPDQWFQFGAKEAR